MKDAYKILFYSPRKNAREEFLANSCQDNNELPNFMKDEENFDLLRILPSQE
jgi:hypothetical protein